MWKGKSPPHTPHTLTPTKKHRKPEGPISPGPRIGGEQSTGSAGRVLKHAGLSSACGLRPPKGALLFPERTVPENSENQTKPAQDREGGTQAWAAKPPTVNEPDISRHTGSSSACGLRPPKGGLPALAPAPPEKSEEPKGLIPPGPNGGGAIHRPGRLVKAHGVVVRLRTSAP